MEIKVKDVETEGFDIMGVRHNNMCKLVVKFQSHPPKSWLELLYVHARGNDLSTQETETYLGEAHFINIRITDTAEVVPRIRKAIDATNEEYSRLMHDLKARSDEMHQAIDEHLLGGGEA